MRISDWSSDVCSSDLQTAVDRRLDIFGIHRLRPRNCARQSGLREGTGAAADQRTETVSRTHRAHSSNLATWPAPPPPRPRHQPVAEPADTRVLEIGRAHVCTPVTNATLVCRHLLEKK